MSSFGRLSSQLKIVAFSQYVLAAIVASKRCASNSRRNACGNCQLLDEHPRGVAKAVDIAQHAALCFLPRLETPSVRFLHLQAVPEAPHRRAIKAVTLATYRLPIPYCSLT